MREEKAFVEVMKALMNYTEAVSLQYRVFS